MDRVNEHMKVYTLAVGLLIIASSVAVGYTYRESIALYLWEELRLFPEVAVSLSDDSGVAFNAGSYYFNWTGEHPSV